MRDTILLLAVSTSTAFSGQVGIGTASPDLSAMLEVQSTNKGILIPRVNLTSSTDTSTVSNPVVGLLVYNTGASTLTYKGLYTGMERDGDR